MITRRSLFLGSAAIILTPGVLMSLRSLRRFGRFVPFGAPYDVSNGDLLCASHKVADQWGRVHFENRHRFLLGRCGTAVGIDVSNDRVLALVFANGSVVQA